MKPSRGGRLQLVTNLSSCRRSYSEKPCTTSQNQPIRSSSALYSPGGRRHTLTTGTITASHPHPHSRHHHSLTSSLPHFPTASHPHHPRSLTFSPPHSLTSSPPHSPTPSHSHRLTSSQPHTLTASPPYLQFLLMSSTSTGTSAPEMSTCSSRSLNSRSHCTDTTVLSPALKPRNCRSSCTFSR